MLSIRPGIRDAVSEPGVDCLHRQIAEHGINISGERAFPGREALRRTPSDFVRSDACLGALSEGYRLGGSELRVLAFNPTLFVRVEAFAVELAALAGPFISCASARLQVSRLPRP
jgi:hypothetical protein